jgi:hypothetical protein
MSMAKNRRKRAFGQITRLPSARYRARYTGPDVLLHNPPTTFDTSGDADAWLRDRDLRLFSMPGPCLGRPCVKPPARTSAPDGRA